MEADDFLCSRNARPQKDEEGSGQMPFLLAERAHSESARSMRAVKGSLGHSPKWRFGKLVGPRPG